MNQPNKLRAPDGMLKAAEKAIVEKVGVLDPATLGFVTKAGVEGAIGWLRKNPIVPSVEQVKQMRQDKHGPSVRGVCSFSSDDLEWAAVEWQRRMFLVPKEDEFERDCEDLVTGKTPLDFDALMREAYNRGRESALRGATSRFKGVRC